MDSNFQFFNCSNLRIGIACSCFYQDISSIQLDSCKKELKLLGILEKNISVKKIPGALELALILLHMARTYDFDALIALGAVIRGESYHFQVVSHEMASSISRVSLENRIPIANGVLTVNDYNQALVRASKKGIECAKVSIEMANLISDFSQGK